jgi:hypothetical protein
MDLLYGFLHIAIGIFMTLKGFKILKSSKAKDENEIAKEELWHSKWGTFFKIGGIVLLIAGIVEIINNM